MILVLTAPQSARIISSDPIIKVLSCHPLDGITDDSQNEGQCWSQRPHDYFSHVEDINTFSIKRPEARSSYDLFFVGSLLLVALINQSCWGYMKYSTTLLLLLHSVWWMLTGRSLLNWLRKLKYSGIHKEFLMNCYSKVVKIEGRHEKMTQVVC